MLQAQQVVKALINQADIVYSTIPIHTIINKPRAPPGGDKRYYWSVGPYFWPQPITPENPRGEPYFRRDGVFNTEVHFHVCCACWDPCRLDVYFRTLNELLACIAISAGLHVVCPARLFAMSLFVLSDVVQQRAHPHVASCAVWRKALANACHWLQLRTLVPCTSRSSV